MTCDTTQLSNHVSKGSPQPQQQPIKTQTTTQHQKQTHNKPPKKMHTQKNPQQQPNKKHTNQESSGPNKMLHLLEYKQLSDIGQRSFSLFNNY